MKKKYILSAVGMLVILISMVIVDMQKVKNEEKPPLPTVFVGEKNVPAVYQSFSWHNGNKQKIKTKPVKTLVEPFNDLVVQFSEKDEPDELVIEMTNAKSYYLPYLESKVEDNQMKLPVYPATLELSIQAKWKDKGEATYRVAVDIEQKTSYQRWLSPSDDGYGLLIIDTENGSNSIHLPPHIAGKVLMMGSMGTQSIEKVREDFPELNIESIPTFVLLDQEKIVLNTNNKKEFISFFESKVGTAFENILPKTDNTISTLSIVNDYELIQKIDEKVSPFFLKSSPMYRTGHIFHENDGLHEYYPELPIEKFPVYFVFDQKGVAYQTYELDEFIQYLKDVFKD
ncbi:hypothetical protein SM124_14055 [Bacillus sp. 31A1R]|uniref:DUF4340 domain-containing protein n=1 Tax=Robertmurraya mangrovi TaxID=3098077 RepID=A0ABU5J0H6_9BACI|nr:hypothetical protein [Bacillus sp. 31A1R]MDZ5472852.1 hypothetical protein [Bacillus sp. 31A1R]